MASVKLTYNDPEVAATANTTFTGVKLIKGWYDVDELQILPGIQHQYLSGNRDEQIAGMVRVITLDFGVVQTFAARKAILYFCIDEARQVNLVISAPTGQAGVAAAGATTLANGTYYYRGTTIDDVGETTAFAQVTVVITDNGNQVPRISWNAATGATGYRLYRTAVSGDYAGEVHFLKELTALTYDDDGTIALTSLHTLPTVQALTVVLEDFTQLRSEWLDGYENAKSFSIRVLDATLRTQLIP